MLIKLSAWSCPKISIQEEVVNIKTDNSSFERAEQFKYLGTTLMHQNSVHKEIKSRTKSVNAGCHLVQNILSSSLLSKNIEVTIHRTIILPVVLHGCKTWSLALRQERRLRVFEKRVLRRIFGTKRDKVIGEWGKLHNEELNELYSSPNINRMIKSRWEWHVARMGEKCLQSFGVQI